MKKPRKSKPVGVLTKTFRIIEALQASTAPMTLNDISSETGINKSTALRFLTHLENERYVSRDSKAAYNVGAKLLHLGVRSTFHVNLLDAAHAPLRELWRITQETVNLGILDAVEVVFLDCIESPQSFRLVSKPGARAVVYRTALGKAMLAHLVVSARSGPTPEVIVERHCAHDEAPSRGADSRRTIARRAGRLQQRADDGERAPTPGRSRSRSARCRSRPKTIRSGGSGAATAVAFPGPGDWMA